MTTVDTKTLDLPNSPRLAYLATIAAIESPLYQTKWASAARVRWEVIHAIRTELDEVGFDWKTACQEIAASTTRGERP